LGLKIPKHNFEKIQYFDRVLFDSFFIWSELIRFWVPKTMTRTTISQKENHMYISSIGESSSQNIRVEDHVVRTYQLKIFKSVYFLYFSVIGPFKFLQTLYSDMSLLVLLCSHWDLNLLIFYYLRLISLNCIFTRLAIKY